MPEIELIETGDGSHSLLNVALNETYHSRHGAVQESLYVFIKQGLDFYAEQHQGENIHILEVGFGTGLNAWLSFQYAVKHNVLIHYSSLETYPLPKTLWMQLAYASEDNRKHFNDLHEAVWNEEVKLDPYFTLHKREESLQQFQTQANQYNIIYFDAFAPNKQPELWELPVLKHVINMLAPGGVFVTYCAKGQLKRDLKSLNLEVESLPGPPGKREMLRATKK